MWTAVRGTTAWIAGTFPSAVARIEASFKLWTKILYIGTPAILRCLWYPRVDVCRLYSYQNCHGSSALDQRDVVSGDVNQR